MKIIKKTGFICFISKSDLFSILLALCFLLFAVTASPLLAVSEIETRALNYFSMGYFYLYENDLPMAIKQFELALESEKNPPALLYSILSELSSMLGKDEDAKRYALQALEVDPESEFALQMMGFVLFKEKRFEEAASYFERLLRRQPNNLQVLFYLADTYEELKNDDKLIEVYRKILQQRPDMTDVSLNLGYLYVKKGAFTLAEKEYRRVLEAEPENTRAIFYLTYIYFSTGRSAEASELFKKLYDKELLSDRALEDYALNLFIEGQNPLPVFEKIKDKSKLTGTALGVLSFINGKLTEAKRLFEKEVENDPYQIAAMVGLIRISEKIGNIELEKKWRFMLATSYYNLRGYDKALKEAEKVKAIDAGFLENRYLLGDIYNAMGRTREAIAEYEYFRDKAEEKGDVFIKLGISYDEIGEHHLAIESFCRAVEQSPQNAELYYFLGIEYRIVRDYLNAVEAFKKAIDLNNSDAKYYFNLGVSYERLGKIDEAIIYLDKSVQLDDSNAPALNYLGYLLADKGIRLAEAKLLIEKALAIDPFNGAYLDSMGWVYYRLAEYVKARDYIEDAVQYMDKTDAENYLIYEHLGDVYYKLGEYRKAVEAWERAIELKDVEEVRGKIEKVQKEIR
jgi:tetratricopeptide (TPR) repeat protein